MPKIKSNRSAQKRFRKTGTGKIVRRSAGKSHLLRKKSKAAKRRLSGNKRANVTYEKNIAKLI